MYLMPSQPPDRADCPTTPPTEADARALAYARRAAEIDARYRGKGSGVLRLVAEARAYLNEAE